LFDFWYDVEPSLIAVFIMTYLTFNIEIWCKSLGKCQKNGPFAPIDW